MKFRLYADVMLIVALGAYVPNKEAEQSSRQDLVDILLDFMYWLNPNLVSPLPAWEMHEKVEQFVDWIEENRP